MYIMNESAPSIKPFAWGLIGTGRAASDFAGDLPHVTERDCFVKAVLGPEGSEELLQFAEEHQIPLVYTDMQAFLEEAQVDAVYIAAPATFRYPYAIRCLQGGVPVLCASPMAVSTAQATTLSDVSKRTGVFLMEGMSLRFLPSFYTLLSILHTKSVGDLISIKASLTGKDHVEDVSSESSMPGAGALLDLGSYPLFLALCLFGEPLQVKATGRISPEGNDESCHCLLSFEGGRQANIECSEMTNAKDEAVITGTKGTITLRGAWHRKPDSIDIALTGDIVVSRHNDWEGQGLQYEIADMLRGLKDGCLESELMSHRISIRIATVLEEIRNQLQVGTETVKV